MGKSIKLLNAVLADTYILGIKTHAAHWNVTGPHFSSLHLLFSGQYTALLAAADLLAERLRALGHKAPSGAKDLLDAASLQQAIGETDGIGLVKAIAKDHRAMSKSCASAITAAEEAGDKATVDLLTTRIEEHDKTAWMLEATAA